MLGTSISNNGMIDEMGACWDEMHSEKEATQVKGIRRTSWRWFGSYVLAIKNGLRITASMIPRSLVRSFQHTFRSK